MKKLVLIVCVFAGVYTFCISCSNSDTRDTTAVQPAEVSDSDLVKLASQPEMSYSILGHTVFTLDSSYILGEHKYLFLDVTDENGHKRGSIRCNDSTTGKKLKRGDKFMVNATAWEISTERSTFLFDDVFPLKTYIVTDTASYVRARGGGLIKGTGYRTFGLKDMKGRSYPDLLTFDYDLKPKDTVLACLIPKEDQDGKYWKCERLAYINGVKLLNP